MESFEERYWIVVAGYMTLMGVISFIALLVVRYLLRWFDTIEDYIFIRYYETPWRIDVEWKGGDRQFYETEDGINWVVEVVSDGFIQIEEQNPRRLKELNRVYNEHIGGYLGENHGI